MFEKICKLAGGVILTGLLAAVFPAAAFPAGTTDELYVMKGGVTYVLAKTSDSPEKYFSPVEPGVFFESNGDTASLRFGRNNCPNYVLIRRAESDGEIIVTADGVNYRMLRVVSASGARYEAPGDSSTMLWSSGISAALTIRGKRYPGYDLRLPDGGIWIPGEGIPADVEWRVRSINGVDVIAGSEVTLCFGTDGRLRGNASVNNYTAPWMSVGNRLFISTAAATRMMGSEELTRQEDSYLAALAGAVRFMPLRDGLALLAEDGGEIVLER